MNFNRITLLLGSALLSFASQADQILTVNRFAGLKNFQRARQSHWIKKDSGHYEKLNTPQLSEQFSCDTIFAIQQQFSFVQMIERKYIDAEVARKYRRWLEQYSPAQVSLIEYTDTSLPTPKNILPDAEPLEQITSQMVRPAHSGLAVISGQHLDPQKQLFSGNLLPWQHEPHLAETSKILDRSKYKFIWEWSRAVTVNQGMDEVIRRAILLQLEELYAYQGNLDEAWVTFRSLEKIHTRYYKQRFPQRAIYDNLETGESLYLVPIKEVIEQFKPEHQSALLTRLLSLGMDWDLSFQWIRSFKRMEQLDLDVIHQGALSGEPVSLTNLSDLHALWLDEALKEAYPQASLSSLRKQIRQALNELPAAHFVAKTPYQQDHAFTPGTAPWAADQNAIVITNLNPALAQKDPLYAARMLVSTLRHLYHSTVDIQPNTRLVTFLEFLRKQEVRFVVQTFDETIMNQLSKVPDMEIQRLKINGLDVPDTNEIYRRVVQNGLASLNPEQRVMYRMPVAAVDFIDWVNETPTLREQFNEPTYELYPQWYGIYREILGIGQSLY